MIEPTTHVCHGSAEILAEIFERSMPRCCDMDYSNHIANVVALCDTSVIQVPGNFDMSFSHGLEDFKLVINVFCETNIVACFLLRH